MFFIFTGIKNTHRAVFFLFFFYHPACKSKRKKWSESSQRVTDLFWIPMLAFQTRSYLVSWSQGIFAVGSNRSSYSRQKTNNKSDSDCNIGIQVRTRSHTSWQTAEVPLHVCGKCEKCMAGKFCVTSNTMTHFFFFFFGDCAALLPPCQCMLLSTAITRGITVHFVNNGSTRFVFFWAFQHGRRWSTYSRTQIILNRQYKQWFDFFIYMNLPE